MFLRGTTAALVFFLAMSLPGQQSAPVTQRELVVRGLGIGSVELGGPWRFHRGDGPRWAAPDFNDSRWKTVRADSPWGSQGYPGYTGFAWYRRRVRIEGSTPGNIPYALLVPPVDDAYELFWNGKEIGASGALPPHPHWYYTTPISTFALPAATEGMLAIRVWKSPLLFVDPGTLGGLNGAPLLGDPDSIAAQLAQVKAASSQQFLYEYTLMVLYGIVTLLSLLLWRRNRSARLFLWLAIFTATPVVLSVLQGVFPIQVPISYGWGRGLNQPIYALNHVSLWFLLLYLLRLDGHRALARWTQGLAICTLAAGVLDGALAFFWGHAGFGMQWADGVLTAVILVVGVFPFVLIGFGLRQRLELSRWLVALSALVSQMISTVADASAAGQRFTHWTLFQRINTPLFVLNQVTFTAADLAAVLLFLSVLFAVYRYGMEQQARQNVLEREMHSAQEIQRVLIPDELPSLEGYAVTSAYRPAQEVGGDFFQILREKDGSTMIAMGDVSGKGLKAAMNVSLIVGVLRSLSDAQDGPAKMLEKLNRCLCGRLQKGFVTAMVLRLRPDGAVTLANAGHLPPMLNQKEMAVEGSLPLGLVPAATYDEMEIQLHPGDQFSLYTDGLLEARSATGELFGFERLHALFAARPSARQATEAAVAFGQEDDITVLTLTRLAAWEESTTSLTAPFLEPTTAQR